MIPRKHPATPIEVVRVIAFSLLLTAAGAACAAAEAVGQVSLAIGVSRVISGEGRASAVARAMPVHVGDRIETERGGHIHVRFVDGAYVALRPGSRLTIETYRYDAAHPQESAIRFRLEEGVARAISGKATAAASERFRLNTPLAAIGVRGTDFVVLAEPDRVRVAVYSGAIVLAPLGEGCLSNALGPCATPAARALSADMGQVMLEFQPQQGAPRLVPINGIPSPDRVMSPPAPDEPRGGSTRSNQGVPTAGCQPVSECESPPPPVVVTPPPPVVVTPPPPVVVTPPPPVVVTPPPPPTLVWGHWFAPLPGNTLSQAYAEARAGRQVTVGNVVYGLFRPESPLPVLVSNLGRVDFTLRDAQVHLVRGDSVSLGSVGGAFLSVNFSARTFDTGLTLSHPQVGTASLQAAGSVRNDGIFVFRPTDGRVVAGALTLDGKEAGYLFQQPVTGGNFLGITRWGR